MMRILGRLLKSRDGATIVEFAMTLPVLLILLCGIMEFGIIMITSSIMEGAAAHAARQYKAAAQDWEGGPGASTAQIRTMVLSAMGGFLNANKLRVIARPINSWGTGSTGAGGQSPTATLLQNNLGISMSAGDARQAGQIVQYELQYPYVFMTPIIGKIISPGTPDGAWLIRSSMIVQNEPDTFWYNPY